MFARAVAKGAIVEREPADQAYGERSSSITDPFGHRWMIQTTIETPTDVKMEGFTVTTRQAPVELGYVTLGFADTQKAGRFFGALFGWEAEQGNSGAEYAHIANTRLPVGFTPDGVDTPPVLYFRVDGIDRYAGKVVELGGRVVSRATYDSGPNAVCLDDQGREFQLWEAAPGY
jgi:predicted enzyme related to lactoylglutathione lyase